MLLRRKETRLFGLETTILSATCRHCIHTFDSMFISLSQIILCELDLSVPIPWLYRDGLCMYETGALMIHLGAQSFFTRNIPHDLNHVPIDGLENFRLRKTVFFEKVNVASITVDKTILQSEDFNPTFKP